MRWLNSRIASGMLAIALIALDLGAMRWVLGRPSPPLFQACVVLLPMANILAVGLHLAVLRPRSRAFLLGFEVFGVVALACSVAMMMRAEGLLQLYFSPPVALYEATIGPPPRVGKSWPPSGGLLVGFLFLSMWATWPQLGLALLGGLLARRMSVPPDPG